MRQQPLCQLSRLRLDANNDHIEYRVVFNILGQVGFANHANGEFEEGRASQFAQDDDGTSKVVKSLPSSGNWLPTSFARPKPTPACVI